MLIVQSQSANTPSKVFLTLKEVQGGSPWFSTSQPTYKEKTSACEAILTGETHIKVQPKRGKSASKIGENGGHEQNNVAEKGQPMKNTDKKTNTITKYETCIRAHNFKKEERQ